MVLGIAMKRHAAPIASIACMAALISCGSPPGPSPRQNVPDEQPVKASVTDAATAGSISVEILSRGGQCVLRTGGKELPLAPKPPCYFVRAPGKETAWSFAYKDVDVTATLIVIGTPATENTRKTWNLAPNVVCGEESQGVVVRDGAVAVTRNVQKGGVYCRDSGIDEKEFHGFAHEK
jgi:hypothetical protein